RVLPRRGTRSFPKVVFPAAGPPPGPLPRGSSPKETRAFGDALLSEGRFPCRGSSPGASSPRLLAEGDAGIRGRAPFRRSFSLARVLPRGLFPAAPRRRRRGHLGCGRPAATHPRARIVLEMCPPDAASEARARWRGRRAPCLRWGGAGG